jgi:hypothetical protein
MKKMQLGVSQQPAYQPLNSSKSNDFEQGERLRSVLVVARETVSLKLLSAQLFGVDQELPPMSRPVSVGLRWEGGPLRLSMASTLVGAGKSSADDDNTDSKSFAGSLNAVVFYVDTWSAELELQIDEFMQHCDTGLRAQCFVVVSPSELRTKVTTAHIEKERVFSLDRKADMLNLRNTILSPACSAFWNSFRKEAPTVSLGRRLQYLWSHHPKACVAVGIAGVTAIGLTVGLVIKYWVFG